MSPRIPGVDAGEDFHQRRLAGAVLAHQRMDFARHELELNFVKRPHAGKALVEPFDRNERGHGANRTAIPRRPPVSSREAGGQGAGRRELVWRKSQREARHIAGLPKPMCRDFTMLANRGSSPGIPQCRARRWPALADGILSRPPILLRVRSNRPGQHCRSFRAADPPGGNRTDSRHAHVLPALSQLMNLI